MATYFSVPGVVATPTLDRVGREERLHRDLPKRQYSGKSQQPVRKKPSASSPESLGTIDLVDGIDAPERRFDFTA